MSASKTSVRLGDRLLEVVIDRDPRHPGRITARVEGRQYLLSVHEPQRGLYSFLQVGEENGGGRSLEAVVTPAPGEAGAYGVRLRGRVFEGRIERPGSSGGRSAAGSAGGPSLLKAVMPGKVVRVLAQPGAPVRRGQGIIVVEAMKMENELGSPRDGVVKEILASPGESVEAGASLALID